VTLTYKEAEQQIAERLGEDALRHCRAVAETAAALASIYGADVEHARLAGLLHDWHRELGDEELVRVANESRLEVTQTDLHVPYLLHARTGAVGVRDAFGDVPAEVVSAIEHHTVGDPSMSELDMIVWIADMIEPARSFPGVADIRECVGTVSLRDLFAQAYTHSVHHLVKTRKRIHPKTVEVWNSLIARERS
jgi:predicted HD superfamily hydrolase involved in NAD metabolism